MYRYDMVVTQQKTAERLARIFRLHIRHTNLQKAIYSPTAAYGRV